MEIGIQCWCIDTADPARIASFWESALGWRRTWEEEGQVCLEPPDGSPEDGIAPDLVFLKVSEGKTVKNRLHLDLRPADQPTEVARLEALGARLVSIGQGDVSWVVMADPDGNEFDMLQPLTPVRTPPLGRGWLARDHDVSAATGLPSAVTIMGTRPSPGGSFSGAIMPFR